MGKISKKPQEKHNSSLSPAVLDFVQKINDASYADLPALFDSWDQRWPYPRGDLMNWVGPLDRFDEILDSFIRTYGLDQGPQTTPFGVKILLEGTPASSDKILIERLGADGDRVLVESILNFSRLLVEKCANRATYNSTDRLNDLLNTTSLSLLHRTLRLTIFLAQRYSERRGGALESVMFKFYDYDHHRLRCLASPVAQNVSSMRRAPTSPVKSNKVKSSSPRSRRTSSVSSPNEFRSLCHNSPAAVQARSQPVDRDWQAWAHVQVAWSTTLLQEDDASAAIAPQAHPTSAPSTPTPLRRQTSATSKAPEVDASTRDKSNESPSVQQIEFAPSDLNTLTIEQALRKCPENMPNEARYELLHKLRIAYGVLTSAESRRELLAIRILGIQVIGNVSSDSELVRNLFGKDVSSQKPPELVQQLNSLIQDPKIGQTTVDLYLQTLSMEAIGVIARHKTFAQDITTAFGASSSNGLLLRLTQRALDDIATDGDATDTVEGDDWREAVFSLPRVVTEAVGHHGRTSEAVYSTAFITAFVSGLRTVSVKAMRVHVRMLDFIKTFFHHFKDGLQVLLQVDTFDIISNLLRDVVEDAWQQFSAGKGIPVRFKTRLTDYEIPYIHRQVLRSIIDLINDVSAHHGANADRAARSLVDAQSLLVAFKLILDQFHAFGTLTWSEVVKALTTFLNNEPTCFTVIAEAGLIKTFIRTVTGSKSTGVDSKATTVTSASEQQISEIPASMDAILNTAQMFQAICLTNAGHNLFKASGLIEKFFEIFESPPHVRVMKDLRALGGTFDELVRHHTDLKPVVMSAIVVMTARVRYISKAMAGNFGAGPILWHQGSGNDLDISGGVQALQREVIPPLREASQIIISLPNGKSMTIEDPKHDGLRCQQPQNEDSHGLTASDYLKPAIGFLVNFFRSQSLCGMFMDAGGTDIVLDLVTTPSLPVTEYSVGLHGHMEELAKIVHMMAELKSHLVLPVLADRMRYACDEFKQFTRVLPPRDESMFGDLIRNGSKDTGGEMSRFGNDGTYIAKCLMAIFCLSQVFGEVFNAPIYSSRSSSYPFCTVNLGDVFADLCGSLGEISAICVREAVVMQQILPELWIKATKPKNFSTGDDEVDQILRVWDNSSQADNNDMDDPQLTQDQETAAFKNVQALRYLLLETPAAIAELFGAIGHGLAGSRRRPDTWSRQKTDTVAKSIAKALLQQLRPPFIADDQTNAVTLDKAAKFRYLVAVLVNVRGSLHDDVQGLGTGEFCQSYVLKCFKDMKGLDCLRAIGEEFFGELQHAKFELRSFAANTGLKLCLDIFDILTTAKVVVSAPQSQYMRNSDPEKAFYFVPGQSLLDFRMEAMPLVREIWTSGYVDQASRVIVHKLVSILKHVLQGDAEDEAVQTPGGHPDIKNVALRKFAIDPQRLRSLKSEGFDEELAKEAIFRTSSGTASSSPNAAKEYCQAFQTNLNRRRLPVPANDIDIAAGDRGASSTPQHGGSTDQLTVSNVETVLRDILSNDGLDSEMADFTSSSPTSTARPQTSTSSAMDLNNILNHDQDATREEAHVPYSVESIDTAREEIRGDLAEQCNNVLTTHQDMVFDLSDLIANAAKKLSDADAKIYWESTSTLLVNSLLSMQTEGAISEAEGRQIAAAAHLIALLIQDKEVFKTFLGVFQENFKGMLSFLKLNASAPRSGEAAYPWVAPILLLVEQMLSQDSEPSEVKWDPPHDIDAPLPEVHLIEKSVVTLDETKELFYALLDCLPRVGKDKVMALSIARVMVMLTRKREIAVILGEKRNLQRLFLMVKQLGVGVSSRFLSSFMLILRHIVEDEETLIEIMRSEIQAIFNGGNAARSFDLNGYTRELHHLVIRSPEIFVRVSNELVKLSSWHPQPTGVPLALKKSAGATTEQISDQPEDQAAASVEGDGDPRMDENKQKVAEIKPPIVENPDGVIHFLLSELLTYKDVEDKDVPFTPKADPEDTNAGIDPPVAPTLAPAEISAASSDDEQAPHSLGKSDKPRFKAEEHPMFMYRCFLLQCLVELLHSYNRTKVEFINFTRKNPDPMAVTPSKPRSGILNYVLNALVASGYVDKDENSVHCKKRLAVSDWAIKVLVALCSKTGEKGKWTPNHRYAIVQINDKDDEPDLTFVRRFVLEHAIKAFKDATASTEPLQTKYSKLLCLSDMFNRLLSRPPTNDGAAGPGNNSYKILGRMMFEKNLISVLTSSLAEINLSQSGARRVIKFILRPLQELTSLAIQLSLTSPEIIPSVLGNNSDDNISSASSVSEVEDEREETPDLYRNSTLGLLDPNRNEDSDSDEGEEEDGDEEMYEEEYDDEMEYDDGMPIGQEDDDAVSDDDEDDEDHGQIEGLSGDIPMDIEFVVNEGDMDIDSGDDDTEADSDDEDDDEDDDDDGEDFDIEDDDGEINADAEGDSVNDSRDPDDGWEDEVDEEDDEHEGDTADAGAGDGEEHEVELDADLLPGGSIEPVSLQGTLNHLLHVFNDARPDGDEADHHMLFERVRGPAIHADGHDVDQEEPDGADEEEDMDENDAIEHDHFDDFMDGDVEDDFYEDQWTFEEPMARPSRGFARRNAGARGAGLRPPVFTVPGFRSGDAPPFYRAPTGNARRRAGQDNDDGTNPLLQRPVGESALPSSRDVQRLGVPAGMALAGEQAIFADFNDARIDLHAALNEHGREFFSRHGQFFDFIASRIPPGTIPRTQVAEPFGLHLTANTVPSMSARLGLSGPIPTAHRLREDPPRAVNFTPATTMTRWNEERAILFGNQYLAKVQRVQVLLMSILAPLAQQEEKERRRKVDEEAEAQRQENERQRVEEERLRKEQEEREAAQRAAEEEQRLAAEAEAAAAATVAETVSAEQQAEAQVDTAESMEGVQSTEEHAPASANQPVVSNPTAQTRIFATIRGRELDITGLDIDREYLDALPEELREEVILQQLSARREEAQQPRVTTGAETDVDAGTRTEYLDDFMNALPEELREEVRQAEAIAQRQRDREAARRQVTATVGRPAQAEDMNADDFFATLDPALRRVILSEQPQEILDRLDPRHAAEGREHGRRIFHYSGLPIGRESAGRRNESDNQRDNKRQVVQLVDKAGVATLLRLMFLPQQGSLRSNLWHILRNVCHNRQTRFEVISMILAILKEGSIDIGAVERSLASLSLRAKATTAQKPPQPLKRPLSVQPGEGLSDEITPLVVVQQCLSALKQLSQHGFHVRTLFLREVDISNKSKKGKERESKSTKYPVNDLIALLERRLITESASSLQSLAELLAAVTSPLVVLMRKDKDHPSPEEAKDEKVGSTDDQQPVEAQGQPQDTPMTEAPAEVSADSAAKPSAEATSNDTEKSPEVKPKKSFEPPAIPEKNLQLIVGIFVASECGNDTFHATLDTMSNISHIPGANEIFGKQLVNHVQILSQSLCTSLIEFLPQLREAQSSTDLHGITSARFSQSGSDQVKLLHVLKALDYLSEPRMDGENDNTAAKSILTASYESLALGPLWSKLSESLTIMGEKDNAISFANILLSLIESLMVVCKNTSLKEAPLAQQLREEGPTTPVMEELNDLEQLFFNFTTEHRKILNDIIRQSPKLMQGNGSFSLLAKNPKVLDFDNKRAFFSKQMHSRLQQQRHVQPPLQLNIRRDQVFQDSYKALYFKSADEMKYGKLNIRFNGEEGVDAGGVTREWFQVLARGIFNPDWALWQPVASDKTTFHPNPLSWINGEHLVYFKFIGRIIGKALHEGRVLDCHFSRAVYKRMLGKQPNLKDLESMDLDYYKSLVWILENDITDILTEDFSVIEEQFGEEKVVDLIPDGRNIPVAEENKRDYVQKLVEYRLTGSVSEQLDHFIRGFHDIIPAELVAIFDEQELELLISGLPEIDVDDWKANTEYHNYNANSPQVTWFWRIVRAMSNEERAKLLQFITGTSKVPLNGFKDLEGMQGTTRFSIHREPNLHRLPTSHTCFNQLDLPAYDNQESLKTSLMKAINLGADYFGFA